MNNRKPLLVNVSITIAHTVALLAGALTTWCLPVIAAAADERPNILLVMCDDLGFSDLGCYGGEIRTPNLDRLAADGLRFTQFYNCAVCVTTRAALVTGLYPRQGGQPLLRRDMATIGELMQAAGYQTALVGKWHLGHEAPRRPTDRGFMEYYGLASGCCNFFNPAQPDPVFYNGGKRRPFLHNEKPVTSFPDDYYTTDDFSERAASMIRRFAKAEQPFFLHVCYTAPHFPLHARPADIARYKGKYRDGYFALRQRRHRRQAELGVVKPEWKLSPPDGRHGQFRYDYDITPWEEVDRARANRRMEVYAAMVDRLDQGFGRVLAALKETGLEKRTIVMFLSDNGGCATLPQDREGMRAYNRELPGGKNTYDFCGPGWGWAQCTPFRRYKTWTYEGGIATPLIVRWPGVIEPGTMTDQVGHVIDFVPTCLELARSSHPETFGGRKILPVEGKSLVSIFQGKTRGGHESLGWFLFGNRAIRQDRWKLVWGSGGDRWELYDMLADRTETNNLAAQHPEQVRHLTDRWNAWAKQVELTDALKNRVLK